MGERPPDPANADPVTALLAAWHGGDRAAYDQLVEALYAELRRTAARQLGGRRGETLQPTALVHEAFLRLLGSHRVDWQGRAHFLGAAAGVMRHVLIDHARARKADKRGGGATHITLADVHGSAPALVEVIALDTALTKLARHDEVKARIVELRYLAGLTVEEAAEALALSPATVKRHWSFAKAWLARELGAKPSGD